MKDPILGIIGGGQLGSLLSVAANRIGIKTVILSDDEKRQLKTLRKNSYMENMITNQLLRNLSIVSI